MDVRVGLLVLLVLAGNWACDARELAGLNFPGLENSSGNMNACKFCVEYATKTIDYLNDENNQKEVMENLYDACSQTRFLAKECTELVDSYASLFFSEVSSVQPEQLCKTVGLCSTARKSSLPAKTDKCTVCHQTVDELLERLNDPDTELGIVEMLLKLCNSVGQYKTKCKRMVFEFGPVLLIDAGKILEGMDVCTKFHACSKHEAVTSEVLPEGKIEMVTST